MPVPTIDAGVLERGSVRLAIAGPLATITLDRPDVLNAQTPATWQALRHIGEQLDPDVRVVVVRGSGRAFSAGLDRRMFTGEPIDGEPGGLGALVSVSAEEADAKIASYQAGFTWLSDPARVTIAAVQGHGIGAGFQLALACDFRVLAEDAQFCMAETGLGLVPDLAGTLPLTRLVGYSRAAEICVTSRRVSAEESLRIGLANSVVPAAELDAAVESLVASVLKHDAGAVRETLALIASAASGVDLETQTAVERSAQLRRLRSFAAAMSAQS